jgi:hypothetical protein
VATATAATLITLSNNQMFESKSEKLVPTSTFARRMVISFLLLFVVLLFALSLGVLGYHYFADLTWIDSILNASMILTGMGPIAPMISDSAKLFASAYALFSGVIFLSSIGLLLAPVFHRILHKFHLDEESNPVNKT